MLIELKECKKHKLMPVHKVYVTDCTFMPKKSIDKQKCKVFGVGYFCPKCKPVKGTRLYNTWKEANEGEK